MSKSKSDTFLGVSTGEPAGIGPDICLQSFEIARTIAKIIYYGDPKILARRAIQLGYRIRINNLQSSLYEASMMNVQPIPTRTEVIAGQCNIKNSQYVIDCLSASLQDAIKGKISGIVTAPINKAIINDAGIKFSGHTEWLAEKTKTENVVMMLATEKLRVALVTTHLALSQVSQAITPEKLKQSIAILHSDLISRFNIENPSILVTGLNPHAGEMGYLGQEEKEIIIPVLEELKNNGYKLKGPIPADTAFNSELLRETDAVLAMYHDQGLPVVKYSGFGHAVNITLGLPIVRTSVDHGTALELAGTGKSDSSSILSAIRCALEMAK